MCVTPGQAPVNQEPFTLLFHAWNSRLPTGQAWQYWAEYKIEPIEDEA